MAAKLSGGGGDRFNVEQNSEINVTPFVDVMLVLLIIFMVAAPLASVSVEVNLPPAVAHPGTANPRNPGSTISIQPGGLFVRFPVGPSDPRRKDHRTQLGAVRNPTKRHIFIHADKDSALFPMADFAQA